MDFWGQPPKQFLIRYFFYWPSGIHFAHLKESNFHPGATILDGLEIWSDFLKIGTPENSIPVLCSIFQAEARLFYFIKWNLDLWAQSELDQKSGQIFKITGPRNSYSDTLLTFFSNSLRSYGKEQVKFRIQMEIESKIWSDFRNERQEKPPLILHSIFQVWSIFSILGDEIWILEFKFGSEAGFSRSCDSKRPFFSYYSTFQIVVE